MQKYSSHIMAMSLMTVPMAMTMVMQVRDMCSVMVSCEVGVVPKLIAGRKRGRS